jgi:hypothetical protein
VTDLGWIGVWLLVIGVVAIVIEAVLAALLALRVGRRARMLSERLASEQRLLKSDMDRLQRALEETQALWQPYRRLLRWLRHPLVIAFLRSYARRRAATG